jgi:hypothetical protein
MAVGSEVFDLLKVVSMMWLSFFYKYPTSPKSCQHLCLNPPPQIFHQKKTHNGMSRKINPGSSTATYR